MGVGLQRIHHVAIICSDYEKSKYFYAKILGLKILNEAFREERKSFKLDLQLLDGSQLELFSFPHPPIRVSRPEACGLRHLAFAVGDIAESIEYLKKQNIQCESIRTDEFTGKRFTFFSDPDNLPIELYEH